MSVAAYPLGGGSDSGSGSGDVLRLRLRLGLNRLGGVIHNGLNLGGLRNDSLVLLVLSLGLVLDFLSLDLLLLLLLGRRLALDGSTELGEGALGRLVLALSGGRGLLTLAEEGEGRLALLLRVLLDLAVGSGGGLGGLGCGSGGGVVHVNGEGGGSLDGRDNGSSLLSLGLLGLGLIRLLFSLGLSSLLLLLGEDATEEAVALRSLVLGALSLGLLDGLVSLNNRGNGGSLLSRLDLLSRLVSLDGRDDGRSLLGLDGLLNLGLLLLLLSGLILLVKEAEERSALALEGLRGFSLLGLLSLVLFFDGLSLLDRLVDLGGLLGGDDRGLLLGGISSSDSGSLLLLGDGLGLVAVEGGLVFLGLGDGGGKLLGLDDLQLELGNPVVALSGVKSLEAVLVALGGQGELVGTLGLGLRGIGLTG